MTPANPKGSKQEKALNKCQTTIGKAAMVFLSTKSKTFAKCWGNVNKTGSGSCPDAATSAAIAKAESKKVAAIKKACEGPDKIFGTADDFTPAQIGFRATCLDVTPPGGSACGGAVSSLQDLIDCVDCVTEFTVDCADRAAVMARRALHRVPMLVLAVSVGFALVPSVIHAVTKCSVKVNPKDGTIDVSATGVSEALQWGEKSGSEPNVFANAATCIKGATAKKCEFDVPGTSQAIIPPSLCTVFLKDSGAECAAYLKGCTPRPKAGTGAVAMRVNTLVGCGVSCFTPPGGFFAGTFANESDAVELSPAAKMVARDLAVETSLVAPTGRGGGTRTFTLRVNGTDTALQCTEQPGDGSCQNTTARVVIPSGSTVSLRVSQGGTLAEDGVAHVAWRATEP